MINCIYHPVENMRVVDDVEYKRLLDTGEWFAHPDEAKKVREQHERKIPEKPRLHSSRRQRGTNLKLTPTNGGETA